MKKIGTFLIAVALVVGMVGCNEIVNEHVYHQLAVSSTSGGSVIEPGEGVRGYEEGTVVDLVAEPDTGYRFVTWTGDVGTVADVNAASTTITMNGDYSVMANFLAVYDLSISSTTGGSVTTPGEGTFTYDAGTVVSLIAAADAGYRFAEWTGDVSTVADVNAASTTVTMNDDYSITADFEAEEPVFFADPNLESAVREAVGIPDGIIYPSDLKELTELWAVERSITDLIGLEYCVNLSGLDLYGNQISDISPLANLTNLTHIWLCYNRISDISPLVGLTNLTHLSVVGNQISDVSLLASLTGLSILWLSGNDILDISPLASLTNLTHLVADNNQISDISPLANLANLVLLDLGANPMSDISPLAGLTSLRVLYLGDIQTNDISPLAGLINLEGLCLINNEIGDISLIANLTNLRSLELSGNPISDVSPLAGLTELRTLYLWANQISDIGPLSGLVKLGEPGAAFLMTPYNGIPVHLSLRSNEIDDIKPLVDNPGLAEGDVVDLLDNPLSQQSINEYIPALEARGVTVHW